MDLRALWLVHWYCGAEFRAVFISGSIYGLPDSHMYICSYVFKLMLSLSWQALFVRERMHRWGVSSPSYLQSQPRGSQSIMTGQCFLPMRSLFVLLLSVIYGQPFTQPRKHARHARAPCVVTYTLLHACVRLQTFVSIRQGYASRKAEIGPANRNLPCGQ